MCSDNFQTYLIAEPPEDVADEIISWGYDNIDDDLLYVEDGYGREGLVHLTFLCNIDDRNRRHLHESLSSVRGARCVLGRVGVFTTNDKYDVVHVEVVNDEVRRMHDAFDRLVENEKLYPFYTPHITVAYLNKGLGERLRGNTYFCGKSFAIEEITVSYNKGLNREKVKLQP